MESVAVRQGRYVAEWLDAGAPFVLNLVAEGDKQLLKHFGRGFEPGTAAFEGIEIERCGRGVPVLMSALGHLACAPRGKVASGDHLVYLAEVEAGQLHREEAPMVHIRKSGANY
jgi:flavin reductase (DIM6/NTAB) family NADH-FMN oxidoreductase RutF